MTVTNNEIIQALECLAYLKECPESEECQYYMGNRNICDNVSLAKDVLDLINRKKAEIEKLNVELVGMRGACESYKIHYDNAQAEIERLVGLIDHKAQEYIEYSAEMGMAGNYGGVPTMGEFLADKILDDGWMRPPVKVGDKVWDTEGNTWKVFAITIWQDCIGLKVENSRERHIHKTFTIGKHSIGKTIFTSREDAVKALGGEQ